MISFILLSAKFSWVFNAQHGKQNETQIHYFPFASCFSFQWNFLSCFHHRCAVRLACCSTADQLGLHFFGSKWHKRRHSEKWALLCWILSWIKAGVPSKPHYLWPGFPSQGCDTRSLDTGSLTKGKNPQSLLLLLAENRLLKTALELKGIVVWKLKSHQMFQWKTEGAASPGTRQRCCSWSARGGQSQGAGQALLNKTHFSAGCWDLLVKPWLWHELQAEEIDVGQERWQGKRARREIGGERGCLVPSPLPAPSLVKRPLQADLSVSLWPAFQHYDALWFYSFLLEVLLKYKQQSISAGIKQIQIKEMRNSPSLQAHFKTH